MVLRAQGRWDAILATYVEAAAEDAP
jgi:hypothetical protein